MVLSGDEHQSSWRFGRPPTRCCLGYHLQCRQTPPANQSPWQRRLHKLHQYTQPATLRRPAQPGEHPNLPYPTLAILTADSQSLHQSRNGSHRDRQAANARPRSSLTPGRRDAEAIKTPTNSAPYEPEPGYLFYPSSARASAARLPANSAVRNSRAS